MIVHESLSTRRAGAIRNLVGFCGGKLERPLLQPLPALPSLVDADLRTIVSPARQDVCHHFNTGTP